MSVLDGAAPPGRQPIIVTICGTPGTGKTELATTFPQPAYMVYTTGEGLPDTVPDERKPSASPMGETLSAKMLWDQLLALTQEDHPYKTVIIDSVTGLEGLFVEDVMKSDPKAKSIQTCMGGYGAGRDAVAAMHYRVRKAAEIMRKRGMHVVFIAHSDISRIDPPDSEGFTQYSLRLHSKSMAPYVDAVDVVCFIKQETAIIGEEGKRRAISTDDRVILAHLTPTAITKNRLGISEEIPFHIGENPFAKWIHSPATKRRRKPEPEPELGDVEMPDGDV